MPTIKEEYSEFSVLIETILSMLTLVYHFKKVMHRRWSYFKTRVGTMALFDLLVQ